jgi:pimeloyl-ACP methyl ester carboxylesterase
MISYRWILSTLGAPVFRKRSLPLVRPSQIEWNPFLTPHTLSINGHTIFYAVKGEGIPLLLIHGFGAGMWVWEKQIDILSQFYRLYLLDLIGHGFSDRPRISYTSEAYLQFLKDFMDGVGVEKATLIGNSMGGGLAWAGAIAFPERVHKLILINTIPPDVLTQVKNESFRTLAAIKDIPFLPYLVIASRSRHSIKRVLHECVSDESLLTQEVIDRQYQLSRIRESPWVLYSTLKNAKEALTFKDVLSSISHPTLLIWGEKDRIFPPPVGEGLHRAIPGSEFRLIKGSGHIPMWETPDEVNQIILSFLKE